MLGAMHTASSAAAPWVVPLVVVLVVAGVALLAAGLAVSARSGADRREPPPSWRRFPDDDLPRFAEEPPGSAAPPRTQPADPRGTTVRSGAAPLLTLSAVILLLAAVTVTVAATRGGHDAGAETAELTFGGVVLEQRAVGITVAYPRVTVHVARARAAAHVRLPTYNCLTDEPPADPVAAGCLRTPAEYADLRTPELSVTRGQDGSLRLSGRFATYTRPNGTPRAATGRAYQVTVTARPRGHGGAEGEFVLGAGRIATVADRVNVLRSGG